MMKRPCQIWLMFPVVMPSRIIHIWGVCVCVPVQAGAEAGGRQPVALLPLPLDPHMVRRREPHTDKPLCSFTKHSICHFQMEFCPHSDQQSPIKLNLVLETFWGHWPSLTLRRGHQRGATNKTKHPTDGSGGASTSRAHRRLPVWIQAVPLMASLTVRAEQRAHYKLLPITTEHSIESRE